MGLGRYSKVYHRIWSSQSFRRLSPLPPSGQSLWLFLLTTRLRSPIPGLIPHGLEALAGEVRWSQKAFREAFAKTSKEDMTKADWNAPLVYLPNSIIYNAPESPNVVTSWGRMFDDIPECSLKVECFQQLKAFMEGYREGFAKAFREAFPEPFAKTSPKQEQEHEQEQEQEQENDVSPEPANGTPPSGPTFPVVDPVGEWVMPEAVGAKLSAGYPALDLPDEFRRARAWLDARPERRKTRRGMPRFLQGWLERSQNGRGGKRPAGARRDPDDLSHLDDLPDGPV